MALVSLDVALSPRNVQLIRDYISGFESRVAYDLDDSEQVLGELATGLEHHALNIFRKGWLKSKVGQKTLFRLMWTNEDIYQLSYAGPTPEQIRTTPEPDSDQRRSSSSAFRAQRYWAQALRDRMDVEIMDAIKRSRGEK